MLRTFGEPVLLDSRGRPITTLRRKDLALLIYLCVCGARRYSRTVLATMLWGEGTEAHARHSLTQALRRVRRVVRGALETRRGIVEWKASVECDAVLLMEASGAEREAAEKAVDFYTDPFLRDFNPGRGAEDFIGWATHKQAELRATALRLVDRLGREAEERADWTEALRLGRKAVTVEAIFEEGHRRIMRAWSAQGERGLALTHYGQYAHWMRREFGTEPDQKTQALVTALREPAGMGDATGEAARTDLPYSWGSSARSSQPRNGAGSEPEPLEERSLPRRWSPRLSR